MVQIRKAISVFLFLIPVVLFSQKNIIWDPAVIETANTAKDAAYLSKEEKAVILYLNLVRLDPELFGKTYLKAYLDSTGDNDSYTKSLLKTLPKTKPMQVLKPDKRLCDFTKEHAVKFGKEGKTGHGNYNDRTKKIRDDFGGYMAENCDYGNKKALDIVMSLLIDEDIKDLGHRINILTPRYKFVGTSIAPHKKYVWNCVMDFGG